MEDPPPPLASPDTEDPDSPYEGCDLCPCCLSENPNDSLFCHNCGAPVDPLAAYVPIPRIWAEGYILRQAATNCTSRLTLVGIWLIGTTLYFPLGIIVAIRATRSYLRNHPAE